MLAMPAPAAAAPPAVGDRLMVQAFCWTAAPVAQMAAFAAAGDKAGETRRTVAALEGAECVFAKLPFPVDVVAVDGHALLPDGSALYLLVVRPPGQAVLLFGSWRVAPEPT